MRYRKKPEKPVEIDAILWTGGNFEEVCKLLGVPMFDGEHCEPGLGVSPNGMLKIPTRTAAPPYVTARVGSFVLKSANGTITTCDSATFRATYDMDPFADERGA